MLKLRFVAMLLMSASAMPLLFGAETGIKDLTPRASDVNSARACFERNKVDTDLETVKAQNGFTRRIVLKGGEITKDMQFCRGGKLHTSTGLYRIVVPAGEEVVVWVNEDGTKGVIEGCINTVEFVTPIPPEPAPPTAVVPPNPVVPDIPSFDVPWVPVVPPEIPNHPRHPENACQCVAIMTNYGFSELHPDSPPIEFWVVATGKLADSTWYLDGKEMASGLHVKLDAKKLYDLVKGKGGQHSIHFGGHDLKGNVVGCGTGFSLTLVKKGRRWWWKLPLTHCVYTFTHDLKKLKGGPLVEKLVCPAEIALVIWLASPAALIEFKTGAGVSTLAP
jgi:hypothetical protein